MNNLQILRALAAYSVVVYHCLISFPFSPGFGARYIDMLSGGVDLFFVISGFVMVHTTQQSETPSWFMTKRIARIVPLYWLATLLVAALAALRPWTFPDASVTPDSILASLAFVPHLDASGYLRPVLGVGWTLNYEMMFYALFALALLLPHTLRLTGVIVLITLVWGMAALSGDDIFAEFYGNPIVFEFASGCAIAYALRLPQTAGFIRKAPMWPLALTAISGLLGLTAFAPDDWPSLLRYGIPLMLLVFAAAGQDLHRRPAPESILTRLGDASYSAYLLHPIILMGLSLALLLGVGNPPLAHGLVLVLAPPLTAIVSLCSLSLIERPAARAIRSLFQAAGLKSIRTAGKS